MEFLGVSLDGVKAPANVDKIPKKPGSLIQTTLASVISWIINGTLHPYLHNRGKGVLSAKTLKSAAQGVNVNSLGECTIGLFDNGNGDMVMTLADFHSRLAGFLDRYSKGQMTASELVTQISVRVAVDFMDSYRQLNDSDPHRNKHKIRNPNLAYGPIVTQLFDCLTPSCVARIGENKWTIISSIIYNMTLPNRDWNWPKVYQKRQLAAHRSNDLAGSINISQKEVKRLIEAIQSWNDLMEAIEEKANLNGVNVTKITNNAGLFGFLVCDKMWVAPRLSTNPILTKRIMRHLQNITPLCPELCRGNRQTVEMCTARLDEMLRRKEREDDKAAA